MTPLQTSNNQFTCMVTLPLYDPMILKLIACVALQSSSEHGIRSQIKRTLIICTALFATVVASFLLTSCTGVAALI